MLPAMQPQSRLQHSEVYLSDNIPTKDIIFSTSRMVPRGYADQVNYVIYVSPEECISIPTESARADVGRTINRLNTKFVNQVIITIGPGRWSTRNLDLGVYLRYSDIYNIKALIEVTGQNTDLTPEPSFGTHFFQDLVEAHICPLAIDMEDEDVIFNLDFFYKTPNQLADLIPVDSGLTGCLHLKKVSSYRPEHFLRLVMDDEHGRAVAYLAPHLEE